MQGMQWWEIGLWAVAGLIAVSSLVHLMRTQRDNLMKEMRRQMEAQRQAELAEKRRIAKQKQKAAAIETRRKVLEEQMRLVEEQAKKPAA